jgi:alpha-beta hydrolase superfamily lysophospholipase
MFATPARLNFDNNNNNKSTTKQRKQQQQLQPTNKRRPILQHQQQSDDSITSTNTTNSNTFFSPTPKQMFSFCTIAYLFRRWKRLVALLILTISLIKVLDSVMRSPRLQAFLFYRQWTSKWPPCNFNSPQQEYVSYPSRIFTWLDYFLPQSMLSFRGVRGATALRIRKRKKNLGVWFITPIPRSFSSLSLSNSSTSTMVTPNTFENCAVLYHHGQSGHRGTRPRTILYERLAHEIGIPCVTFDGRGFADSLPLNVVPSERSLLEDAYSVWSSIITSSSTNNTTILPNMEISSNRVVLWGHGLGAAVAADLCLYLVRRGSAPACLVLEAPFTCIASVVGSRFSWIDDRLADSVTEYASEIIGKHRFNLEGRIKEIASNDDIPVPILILAATNDTIVPAWHADRLADLASAFGASPRIVMQRFDGCNHDDIPQHKRFLSVVGNFLTTSLCPGGSPRYSNIAARKQINSPTSPPPHGDNSNNTYNSPIGQFLRGGNDDSPSSGGEEEEDNEHHHYRQYKTNSTSGVQRRRRPYDDGADKGFQKSHS